MAQNTSGVNFFAAISTHSQVALLDGNTLAMLASCDTVPETQANVYQKGCILIRTDNGTTYVNTGTSASPTWTLNGVGSQGTAGVTGATGPTGPTGP